MFLNNEDSRFENALWHLVLRLSILYSLCLINGERPMGPHQCFMLLFCILFVRLLIDKHSVVVYNGYYISVDVHRMINSVNSWNNLSNYICGYNFSCNCNFKLTHTLTHCLKARLVKYPFLIVSIHLVHTTTEHSLIHKITSQLIYKILVVLVV